MNTQQLECFVCVADKLNFTKAAEELFLSTPTVTHHIKNLEEELGTKLFIRNSKMVRLTEMGNMFYSDAKDILNKIEVSQKRIAKATSQNTSFLRIGCSSYAELNKLQGILSDLRIAFPQVYPLIFMEDYFKLKNLFNNKHLDIMLSTKEMIKDMKECSFKKLKNAKNYAIMSSQSILAEKDSLTFDDLKTNCLIILNPKFIPFQHGNILQEKIALHSQNHFNIVCENDQASILLANCGYGIAILPEHCIPTESDGFIIRPIIEEAIIEYGIAYQKNVKEKYIRFFIDNFTCL
ncbi:LysR family transcriptional regulator [Clostridioides difficile]